MSITEKLTEILKSSNSGPFLFIGSGFSRRYLNLEDWEGLLSKFCLMGKPFKYYLATSNGDMPSAAKKIAKEFNEYWWSSDLYKDSVEKQSNKIVDETSALRLEISRHLIDLGSAKRPKDDIYKEEIKYLSSLNVDGIITTNWDNFLETLFPDYKVYIGQNELLFSHPQEIGEIYKIHGCASNPMSLVLTSDDYSAFEARNPYLAAKLITVFVEHPVVFIGYSLSDPNITKLLSAISLCVGKDQIEKLRKNLIFVQRTNSADEDEGISDTYMTIDGVQIPIVLVKACDYSNIYKALASVKRKIPARVLRYCKEQLFELVKSVEPEKKLCVVNLDEIENKDDIEFLVGLGINNQDNLDISSRGYDAIDNMDLINDVLHETGSFESKKIVDIVIKRAGRNTIYTPVFKYLNEIGIKNQKDYEDSKLPLDKWVKRDSEAYKAKQYAKTYFKRRHESMKELIDNSTPEIAAMLIPFIPKDKLDLEILKKFVIDNSEKLDYSNSSYASYFRKLVTLYDQVKWGWFYSVAKQKR